MVTVALTVKEAAPGTFVRNGLGGAFFTPKQPAFYNEWWTGAIIGGDIPYPKTYNYEEIVKITTTRYGNREILQELIDNGDLPGPVAGWSLIRTWERSDDDNNWYYTLTARKAGQADVSISDRISVSLKGSAFSYTTNQIYTYASQAWTLLRSRGNWEEAVEIALFLPSGDITLNGLSVGSNNFFYYYPDPGDKSTLDSVLVYGAEKISSLIGTRGFDPYFSDPGPTITGSISFGATRAVKNVAVPSFTSGATLTLGANLAFNDVKDIAAPSLEIKDGSLTLGANPAFKDLKFEDLKDVGAITLEN